ncbi:MAG: TonB family protein [bacterium]
MKNKIIIAILSVIICVSLAVVTYSQTDSNSVLYPIEVDGKYGYINKEGKVVLKPKFDVANDFSEGLASVKIGTLWGYIDNIGRFIIKPKFHIANDFHEGLAAAGYEKYNYNIVTQIVGYIDKQGKYVIKPKELGPYIYDFKDGIVAVQSSDAACGYIDRTGKLILDPQKLGYFNMVDGVCIEFSEGLLPVEYKGGYGYINKQGKLVIKTKAYFPEDFGSEDFIPIGSFYNGFAFVRMGKNEVYIDKNGEIIKNPPIEAQKDFSEGLVCEYLNDKYGYTDKSGNIVIKPIFDYAEPFKNGLARAEIGNKYGYIDKSGKFIWFNIRKPENTENQTTNENDTDFEPYMLNLQEKIKANWHPPKGDSSKKVIVLFKVDKQGKVLNSKIKESSGDNKLDSSALETIDKCNPFDPLPSSFKENNVDIEYTFVYNLKNSKDYEALRKNKIVLSEEKSKYFKKEYGIISNDKLIGQALDLLNNSKYSSVISSLRGNNKSEKPIQIYFKELSSYGDKFANFDALGWTNKGYLYIYINEKHIDAPAEAIASLIARIEVHQDEEDSLNEEIYSTTREVGVWNELIKNNPEVVLKPSELVTRENKLLEKYKEGNYTNKFIKNIIYSNSAYQNLPQTSPGFETIE